jgi:hypothetical protein
VLHNLQIHEPYGQNYSKYHQERHVAAHTAALQDDIVCEAHCSIP